MVPGGLAAAVPSGGTVVMPTTPPLDTVPGVALQHAVSYQ